METKSKNIIELNGKRYDTTTGKVVSASSGTAVAANRNIDGFFRATRRAQPVTAQAQKITVLAAPAPQTHAKPAPGKRISVHTQPHKPQNATTLMRRSVKRPALSMKQQTHIQGSLQHKLPSLIVPKKSAYSLDEHRLARATAVKRSPHISRHAAADSKPLIALAPLTVKPAPSKPAGTGVVPAPQPTNKPLDIFEHAIANASHFVDLQARKHHLKRRARRHLAVMTAGTLALVVLGGFTAYRNLPSLQLKVASLRAGISAHMPDLAATGFSWGGVSATDGHLVVGLSHGQGSYYLTQQPTNWDSGELISTLGSTDASGTPTYRTLQVGNLTVFRLNGSTASWIRGGTWYTITGNQPLADTQVASLVRNS